MSSDGQIASGSREYARTLGFAGSPNFRDAGGYATANGGRLRWRRLFRSGHLALLTEPECDAVQALSLDMVVDLRREDEQTREPSRLPEGVRVLSANITPGSQASAIYRDSSAIDDRNAMFAFMCDINRQFVTSQTGTYRKIFMSLLDSGAERVLFNCSAGKDRTGFAIAVLHLALDVPQATLREDYLLSGDYYDPVVELPRARSKYPVAHLADEQLLPMLSVHDAYLDAALAAMSEQYGSIEGYLSQGLGLDEAARHELRRRFCEERAP
jgi:protein-tyrosine phosphatase